MSFKTKELIGMVFTSVFVFSCQICITIINKLKSVKNKAIGFDVGAKL